MKKDEKKQTIFRRIKGRIVPISIGVASGSAAIGLASIKNKKFGLSDKELQKAQKTSFSQNYFKGYNTEFVRFKNQEKLFKPIKKQFYKEIQNAGLNPFDDIKPIRAPFQGSYVDHTIAGTKIYLSNTNKNIFLHELGHAYQRKDNFLLTKIGIKNRENITKFVTKSAVDLNKLEDSLKSSKSTIQKFKIAAKLEFKQFKINSKIRKFNFINDVTRFGEEVDAWKRAYKLAQNSKQKKAVLLGAKKYLPSYFPLVKNKIAAGLGILSLGSLLYGIRKDNK